MSVATAERVCACGCGSAARSTYARGHNPRPVESAPDRFWRDVAKGDGCWTWVGSTRKQYGRIQVDGRAVVAHRFAYELLVGPIPEGKTLDHLCRNTLCVNPDHLEPVTLEENIRRAHPAVRSGACAKGHAFTAENTYRPPGSPSRRICRTCQRERRP